MNLCTACGQDFGSLTAFDKHRVGKYPQTGPTEYTERLDQELIKPEEQWRSEPRFGRRCLTPEEMQERGMQKDDRGRWRLAARGTPPWASDVRAKIEREPRPGHIRHTGIERTRGRDTSPRSSA